MTGPTTAGDASEQEDDALLHAFDSGRLAVHAFGHAQHVRVAWLHVTRFPLLEALRRQIAGVSALTAAAGVPEKFHATLTIAWVLEIAERSRQTPDATTWAAFAERHPDLLAEPHAVLGQHYSASALRSEAARRGFVTPDIARSTTDWCRHRG